jgi:hypothetical protein
VGISPRNKCVVSNNKFSSPDRWDNLPAAVLDQPGLLSNLLTFSGGPRVYIFLSAIASQPTDKVAVLCRHAIFDD